MDHDHPSRGTMRLAQEFQLLLQHLRGLNPAQLELLVRSVGYTGQRLLLTKVEEVVHRNPLRLPTMNSLAQEYPASLETAPAKDLSRQFGSDFLVSFVVVFRLQQLAQIASMFTLEQLVKLRDALPVGGDEQRLQVMEHLHMLCLKNAPNTITQVAQELKDSVGCSDSVLDLLVSDSLQISPTQFMLTQTMKKLLQLDYKSLILFHESVQRLEATQIHQLLSLLRIEDSFQIKEILQLIRPAGLGSEFSEYDQNSAPYGSSSSSSSSSTSTSHSTHALANSATNHMSRLLMSSGGHAPAYPAHSDKGQLSYSFEVLEDDTDFERTLIEELAASPTVRPTYLSEQYANGRSITGGRDDPMDMSDRGGVGGGYSSSSALRTSQSMDSHAMSLQIVDYPPAQSVYKRNLKPNPSVSLHGDDSGVEGVLYVAPVLVEGENMSPLEGKLNGADAIRITSGRLVVFKKLKIMITSHQQNDTHLHLRFELRRYPVSPPPGQSPTGDYEVLDRVQTGELTVKSHSTQIRQKAPPKPVVHEVIPTWGGIEGNTKVALVGAHFIQGQHLFVRFGEEKVAATFHGPGTIVCRTPKHPEGVVDVQVSNDDDRWSERVHTFTFRRAPRLNLVRLDGGDNLRPLPLDINRGILDAAEDLRF